MTIVLLYLFKKIRGLVNHGTKKTKKYIAKLIEMKLINIKSRQGSLDITTE